ncbi:MAG: ATP-binding cassette domain-containing protein [Candidatus Latescibacteria bacterium]|nr:ATP-binding cassette domain-containing protein [Candidatus Latescibacterota bacterium]NIM21433.1 ATP-binding cassette domain-containing protein [Candidatus Latescibacterota bacterium]NIM65614.1 ATP-binding cassette domain-containing protein [Candidatus Latescibacterota bacterium]NIO01994.1 ATP-binding cassette domain-containing protein [Candidatus Latescibacterota bacterium]NIO28806.1 ATP-binding cassette domain-containing protein [Candidatus Latescibacterota bacterium]
MIVVEDLWKTFKLSRQQKRERGDGRGPSVIHAVAGISFTCQPGRIFSLLGPNGAGKTTALRLIATLLKPTKGSITVAGYDVRTQSQEVRRRLGFLTGTTKLYERLTPNELVRYYANLHGMERGAFDKRKEELFSILDMHDFANRRIGKLSSGMRQKVSIVRTMIHDPDILVFDEPTVGLDVITSKNIIELIRSCKEAGKTVIFSTHIMGEVSLLSDDLAIIYNGELRFKGTHEEFKQQMQTRSLEAEFIRLLEEPRK